MVLAATALSCGHLVSGAPFPAADLQISPDHRFLIHADGRPFFYLGDTAWELFHRATREDADLYLQNRARKGFTVIQAVAIAEMDGLRTPNAYGFLPFENEDPARPATVPGRDNDYWDHVDYVVNQAQSLGLYVGLLPTWGRYWHDETQGRGPLFTATNAYAYGEWLGRRYENKPIIWILGGDRAVETERQKEVLRALAKGLRQGDHGKHLITFHPRGGGGSAQVFHDEPWLDFNMRQNGHGAEFTGHYDQTRIDYDRQPPKPVIDGEPLYEDHPMSFKPDQMGHSVAADVRRPLYWDLFGGACGHTYGNHAIWQFWQPGRDPVNRPLLYWKEALDQPGAMQMKFAGDLLLSRPYLSRIPDDSIIVPDPVASCVPGAGRYRFAATRDRGGSYALVYAPVSRAFRVRLSLLSGSQIKAWWFNPRDGTAQLIGTIEKAPARQFQPPDKGEFLDWVLVLDDASRNYPAPGRS